MTTNSAPRAVVAGHGSFAAGLVSAVEQITGLGDVYAPISNSGLTPTTIEAAIREALVRTGATVVFTDLPAGSCTMIVRRLARAEPGITIVTGVTLPTLLAFALGASVEDAVAKGHEALTQVDGPRGT